MGFFTLYSILWCVLLSLSILLTVANLGLDFTRPEAIDLSSINDVSNLSILYMKFQDTFIPIW